MVSERVETERVWSCVQGSKRVSRMSAREVVGREGMVGRCGRVVIFAGLGRGLLEEGYLEGCLKAFRSEW